jgi:beta-glucosidase
MAKFPVDFRWGAATAAYQVEGAAYEDGRGLSIWDTFCKVPGNVHLNDSGDVACDHYHRFLDDIAMMKKLGLKSYRFSFSWTRMFPNGDDVREERGFAFYDKLINALLEAGIIPLATLYHWDLPQTLQDKGGWVNRDTVDAFGKYATAIAEHFGDRVKDFLPINEPWVVAWLGYGIGIHAPGHKSRQEAFAAAHHTVIAHAVATNAMRAVRSDLKIGPVLNQGNYVPDDATNSVLAHAADMFDAYHNRFWIDAFFHGTYPEILMKEFSADLNAVIKPGDMQLAQVKNDFIGINFYNDTRIGLPIPNPSIDPDSRELETAGVFLPGLLGLDVDTEPHGELTEMGWPLTPDGIRKLLVRWKTELGDRCPDLYITENGCAYGNEPGPDGAVHDDKRIEYLKNHISAVGRAIAEGAPVKGYYQWSLMDNFEWALGYAKRFGIVHVDYQTQKRTPKDSAHWYSNVIKTNGIEL